MVSSQNSYTRRASRHHGLYFDEFATESAWIRETASVRLPPLNGAVTLVIHGEYRHHPGARGLERPYPTLSVAGDGRASSVIAGVPPGTWQARIAIAAEAAARGARITFTLHGVAWTNTLAWLGRVSGLAPLQRFRAQNKNRQLRVSRIVTAEGELIYDFSNRHAPFVPEFARKHLSLGLNVAGFLTADLGVGESARCMVRAADAANIPASLIDLKLPCKNRRGDSTYATRLSETPTHAINVVHLDPPASRDIDHYHGKQFRAGRYNIGYWAWELPQFPDAWMSYFDYFDEIWCPSEFTRAAVAQKSPLPVLAMPHAISFAKPTTSSEAVRARFNLPRDAFLFLFLFDLNSYSERKNPRGVIEAFRLSGLAGEGAALAIKAHSPAGNETELAALRASVADLPNTTVITETLNRADLYALEAACDCFVSLHRAEGFGLALAECMALGKPVIATDWSATTEFLHAGNGLPVRARHVTLEKNHGPYAKGQIWAEPDLHHAAEQMMRIARDRALQVDLGAAARRTIEERFAPAVIGARYRQRLEAISMY